MRKGWVETTLGEVASVIGGGTPSTTNPDFWEGDVIWLTPTEVVAIDGKTVGDSVRKLTQSGLKNSGARLLPAGTVILTSRASVGFAAISERELATNQGFQSLVPGDRALAKYLMFWIQNNRSEFDSRAAGSTFKEISKTNVKSIKLNLPPLQEQKRIVDLISSVDSYINALQHQADSARKSRNAVLHEMLSAGGDGWIYTTIGGVAEFINTRRSPAELSPHDIYVGLEHLQPHDQSISTFGSVSQVSSSLTPFIAENILFGRLRPYLHKVAFAEFSGYCSPEILVMSAKNDCIPRFLGFVCGLDSTISACVEMSAGTRMPRTSVGDLSSINFNLPPKFRQQEIVDLISSVDNSIFAVEVTITETKKLRSALLADLLSGEHEIPNSYDKIMGVA
jgi:type I restriction enzyme S subunit